MDRLDEGTLRLLVFAGVFLLMAAVELFEPRRELTASKGRRWFTNLAILLIDIAVVRLIFPLAAVGVAIWAGERGLGLFNAIPLPGAVAGLASFLALDLAIYAQHVASHKIPLLWRLHRVHHTDRDVDVTTALRFHPVEILLSMVWKGVVIVALGAPPTAVFAFEAVLNGAAMFNHANIRLPAPLEKLLRLAVVTPDMHRVHHSVIHRETDSNYGFNLSVWDRLFRTYVDEPRDGHEAMRLGLEPFQDDRPTRLGWSLWLPFGEGRRRDQ